MQIKFLCLNLWRGGVLIDELIRFIQKEKPDIIAAQEVHNSKNVSAPYFHQSIKTFKEKLNYPYIFFSPCFLEKTKEGDVISGNAIFSKYPIQRKKTVFYDVRYGDRIEGTISDRYSSEQIKNFKRTPRNLQSCKIKISSKTIHIFNTQGIWDEHGKDTPRRLKMGEIIRNGIKNKPNSILAGDFNMNPQTKTIHKVEEILINVFKSKLQSTFNMKRKSKDVFKNIVVDMVFVSKDIHLFDSYCPQVDVSDHLPLVCSFEI